VTDDRGDVSFFLRPSFERVAGRHWMVIRLAVGQDIAWDMLPNPLALRSSITPGALDDLRTREAAMPASGNRIRLRNLRIDRQPVPDLDVTVSVAVTRLRVDGVLRLDCFEQFVGVHWEPHTHRVTLFSRERS
jgi:hypothetical protein